MRAWGSLGLGFQSSEVTGECRGPTSYADDSTSTWQPAKLREEFCNTQEALRLESPREADGDEMPFAPEKRDDCRLKGALSLDSSSFEPRDSYFFSKQVPV